MHVDVYFLCLHFNDYSYPRNRIRDRSKITQIADTPVGLLAGDTLSPSFLAPTHQDLFELDNPFASLQKADTMTRPAALDWTI